MLIKTLLIVLICSIYTIYGQNANTAANAAQKAAETAMNAVNKAVEAAINTANTNNKKAKPSPTPAPIPSNTTIRGKVFYEDDGKPVRRSVVVFFKTGSGRESQTLTDENGNFEIHNVKAGNYFPMLLSAGIVNFFSSIDFGKISEEQGEKEAFKDAMQGFQEIVVDGKNNLEVKIPVRRGGAISGKVTLSDGTPVTSRSIQLLRKVNGKLQPVISNFTCLAILGIGLGICNETDERGMFRFSGMPAGEYFVRVNEPAIHGKNSLPFAGGPDMAFSMMFGLGAFLNTYYPNTIEASQAQSIKVEFGKEQKDINITIPDWKLYKISGKVISSKDGKPVKSRLYIVQRNEYTTNVTPPTFSQYRTFVDTDNDGNWSFNEIPKGNYTLLIEPYSNERLAYMSATNTYSNSAYTAANSVKSRSAKPKPTEFSKISQNLTVANSNLENVEIQIFTEAGILGTVTTPPKIEAEGGLKITAFDENENPIESEYVYLEVIKSDSANNLTRKFEIKRLPQGKIKLKFELSKSNLVIKSATVNGIDLLKDSIELKEGQNLSNVKIVLEQKK